MANELAYTRGGWLNILVESPNLQSFSMGCTAETRDAFKLPCYPVPDSVQENMKTHPQQPNHKCRKHAEEKIHRLWQLLIAIHTALEAAKGCAITNSWLLHWLCELADASWQGNQTLRN
ncbi:hypothetical protein E2562_001983 [Oryza meyeriana var. granulata]|uniref:Uncharacterized protein n=1 Tax=Oryza meyeriana var. granulata TaxID=110450 RepID=A0A6G1C3U0_9ORYZ|nr:hypothetical protein E2562_001983 [Oryza meyeriana var. granulata]